MCPDQGGAGRRMGSLVEHRAGHVLVIAHQMRAEASQSRAASIPSTKRYKEKSVVLCVARVHAPAVLGAEAGGP